MSKLLILYNYNNYFNRTIKKFSTYAEYYAYAIAGQEPYIELPKTNFDITDGVNAKHVINVAKTSVAYNKNPNYAVLEDSEGEVSRWFVTECIKVRGGQYQLSLKRDVVADYYDSVVNSPCFIEKGTLSHNDPLIFNSESMSFNEIKTDEILLDRANDRQQPGCAWVVGYIARNANTLNKQVTETVEIVPGVLLDYEDLPEFITDAIEGGYSIYSFRKEVEVEITDSRYTLTGDYIVKSKFTVNEDDEIVNFNYTDIEKGNKNNGLTYFNGLNTARIKAAYKNNYVGGIYDHYIQYVISRPAYSHVDFNYLSNQFDNLVYKKTENGVTKYYKLHFNRTAAAISTTYTKANLPSNSLGLDISNTHIAIVNNGYGEDTTSGVQEVAKVTGRFDHGRITVEEVVTEDVSTTLGANRNNLLDAPYDMFIIPYGQATILNGSGTITTTKEVALAIARGISRTLSKENVYDIQILPYNPFPEIYDPTSSSIAVFGLVEGKDFNYIKNEANVNVSAIFYPIYSRGTFNIDEFDMKEESADILSSHIDAVDKKVNSECNKVRFVSPNYSGIFDVNPEKNEGIDVVNVDYNYKPYSPYIHVAPIFKGLYGYEFNDARGLICGGDFSISTVASAWESYQVQNKNYENIFDRQIQNLDVNNSIAMEKANISAVLGTIQSGITGATAGGFAGSQFGGVVGAGVGAVVGGVTSAVTSAIGAGLDIKYLQQQQAETRSYAVDMYNYNLQNIQALPYSLTKVSAFNENNKIFPFIEVYTCTDTEKEALRNKIRWNGMTIMKIGKLIDYVGEDGFVKGQLIRIEGFTEDSHVLNEIYNEISKGVYL